MCFGVDTKIVCAVCAVVFVYPGENRVNFRYGAD